MSLIIKSIYFNKQIVGLMQLFLYESVILSLLITSINWIEEFSGVLISWEMLASIFKCYFYYYFNL